MSEQSLLSTSDLSMRFGGGIAGDQVYFAVKTGELRRRGGGGDDLQRLEIVCRVDAPVGNVLAQAIECRLE